MEGSWKHRGDLRATKQFIACVSLYPLCGQHCKVVGFFGFSKLLHCPCSLYHAGIAKLLESRFILNTTMSTLWVVPLANVSIFKMQLLCIIRLLGHWQPFSFGSVVPVWILSYLSSRRLLPPQLCKQKVSHELFLLCSRVSEMLAHTHLHQQIELTWPCLTWVTEVLPGILLAWNQLRHSPIFSQHGC